MPLTCLAALSLNLLRRQAGRANVDTVLLIFCFLASLLVTAYLVD